MRPSFALLAPALLVPALLAAAPGRDWTKVVTVTPQGAFVQGNPNARVKLVEYGSYTCPHCAAFTTESDKVLKGRFVRSGSTAYEFRNFVRDSLDLSAAIVARCGGPRQFPATSAAIFAAQQDWLPKGAEFQQANAARLSSYPVAARLRADADGSGLSAIAVARGVSEAQLGRCFADQPAIDRIVAMTGAAPASITGTPSFFVGGRIVPNVYDWAKLEPVLRAAGAR